MSDVKKPGLLEAIIKALRGGPKSTDQDIRSPAAEEISKKLPSPVMPRSAVEKKRKQLRDLDEQTKEE